ncbi:uncharacterized protein LOC135688509 isoform X2 [Rhopilema esculentum]|uniref:uncharacterized protein LOC135688509 isoform X2 n=1 Tax=Rhopilema esculentum TaxID=499914 RepID=UPI0031CFEA6F
MPELIDDGEKYCQGRKCKQPGKRPAVKICHHTDCQEGNNMNPLLLCDDCDQSIHVGQAVCHLRFQLPKNFKRTASIRSTNSDSGNEEETEQRPHFDKKNKGYASARRFFNINSSGGAAKKKVSKSKASEDPGRELLRVRFYEPGCEQPHDSEVINAVRGKSLKESLWPLFEKRGLSFETHSACLDASNTPLPLAFDIYPLGGNILHVRAIEDLKVDKRIIEIAKKAYHRDESKKEQSQKGRKNLFSHLGDEKMQSFDQGRGGPQRRSGIYEVPKLKDVTRTFNDVLDFYSVYGIDGDRGENEDELDGECDEFFMEESWTLVIDHPEELPKKRKDQQEAIWELLTTESNYLQRLNLINKLFLRSLQNLQSEGYLQEIDIYQLFGNIEEVWEANSSFWSKYLKPVIEKARKDKEMLSPVALYEGFSRFSEIFHPYMKYCMEEAKCLQYLKTISNENEKFKTYLKWCEDHKLCNRLKLTDLLVKPMQRLTKYSLLMKAILKKTQNHDDKAVVQQMIRCVDAFVVHVNSALRIRHEQKKMQGVVEKLDFYMPVEPVNDEVEKVLGDFSSFDLNCSVPFLTANEHRCVVLEGPMKLAEKQNRTDVYCFLFTDIFLITKAKRSNEKLKILKQPFRLNKVITKPLKESGGFLFLYLNEYGSLVTAFVLQPPLAEQTKWIQNIDRTKFRYNKARAGRGSTYEFFDDDLNSPFIPVSPHQSPNQERRPSRQQKLSNASYYDIHPSIIVTDQLMEQRKPRSYSIEPRRVTSPHIENSKLSESFDTSSKVVRSVSDPKNDKKIEEIRSRDKAPFWQGSRPASMIMPGKGIEDINAFTMNEQRSRSGSLGLDSPPDDSEGRRNESFRSTSSDTALTRSEMLRNEIRKQIKSSSSAPEVSKVTKEVRRRYSDGPNDSPYSRISSDSGHRATSVSSSSTSVSTERGGLSRDNSFKNRQRDISELDEISQDEKAMGRSTPSFFLELEDNIDLKESMVDENADVSILPSLVDIEVQTEPTLNLSDMYCQTEAAEPHCGKIDREIQTDSIEMTSNLQNIDEQRGEIGIQCDIMEQVTSELLNWEDLIPQTQTELMRRQSLEQRRSFGLRNCQSETDLRTPRGSVRGIHFRSLSDNGPTEVATDANGNHETPLVRKRYSSSALQSPGMRALHFLSRSLESSLHTKSQSIQLLEPDRPLRKMQPNSPVSLRRVALLNSAPASKRNDLRNGERGERVKAKQQSKRATWHSDSAVELGAESFRGSQDDLSMLENFAGVSNNKDEEKPKRPERKKNKGKKKEDKKKKKKDTASHGGVVSGPNMDKRKAQRIFLENSLMHEKPELV